MIYNNKGYLDIHTHADIIGMRVIQKKKLIFRDEMASFSCAGNQQMKVTKVNIVTEELLVIA
jgi:hypothetical protein